MSYIHNNLSADSKELIDTTESLSNRHSIIYAFRRGSNVFAALDIGSRSYHIIEASHPVESVVSLLSADFCLCQNGNIYAIPSCSKGITKVPIDEEIDSQVGCERIHDAISKGDLYLSEKRCKMVCGFDDFLSMVIEDDGFYVVNIYRLMVSSSQPGHFQLIAAVSLPFKRSLMDQFSIAAFQSAIESHNSQKLNPMLFQTMFGDREMQAEKSWAILISDNCGQIFYIPFTDKTKCDILAVPLLCFHQPVVKMQKFLASDGLGNDLESLLVIGSLGKMNVITITPADKDKPMVFDLYLPCPIRYCTGCKHSVFYSDGFCLWKSELIAKTKDEKKFELRTAKMMLPNLFIKGAHCYLFQKKPYLLLCLVDNKFKIMNEINGFAEDSKALPESTDIKEILTSIHNCAVQLNRVCEAEANLKVCLNELACAAYLTLNDRATKLNSSVLAKWTIAYPNTVNFTIMLQNYGSIAIVGSHWHFVVTVSSASGQQFTKSSPLKNGLPVQESATVRFTIDFRNNELPFKISTGLQFCLESGESDENSRMVASFVHLSYLHVDEFNFVSINATSGCAVDSLAGINCTLVEIAKRKQGFKSHNLSPFLDQIVGKCDKSITGFVSINCEYAKKVLRRQNFFLPEIPLRQQVLKYLFKDCNLKIELPANCTLELTIFDTKFKLSIEEVGQFLEIQLVVWNALLLPKLRRAVLHRLHLLSINHGSNTNFQFPIDGSLLEKCTNMKDYLEETNSLPDKKQQIDFSRIYQQIRKDISSRFHFV